MLNSDMPAMPQAWVDKEYWKDFMEGTYGGAPCGLTKREHFAAMAMQGLLAGDAGEMEDDVIARFSISQADALLSALEQSK